MSDKGISYEEALGLGAPPSRRETPASAISYEEALSPRPAVNKPGPLANKEGEGEAMKMVKGAASALAKAAGNVAGAPGDLMELGNAIYSGVMSSPRAIGMNVPSYSERMANIKEKEKASNLDVLTAPTSADLKNRITAVTGEYVPESALGKVGSEALEIGSSMLAPFPGVGRVKGAAYTAPEAVRDFVTGLSSGAGSAIAGEMTSDNPWAKAAGGILGAFAPSGLQAIDRAVVPLVAPERAAQDVSGRILNEAARDPAAVRAALAAPPDAALSATGSLPSTAQLARDPGLDAREKAARGRDAMLGPALDQAAQENMARIAGTGSRVVNPAASPDAARAVAEKALQQSGDALTGALPSVTRAEASEAAREIFDKSMGAAKQGVDTAWQQVRDQSGSLYFNKTIGEVDKRLKAALRPGQLKEVQPVIDSHIRALKEAGVGKNVDVDAINDIRSELLDKARRAGRAGETDLARQYQAGADAVMESISNKSNWLFGDDRAVGLWEQARKATRDYHQTFRDDVLRPLSQETSAGMNRVADGATLRRLVSGDSSQAAQNVEQFLKAAGPAAAPDVKNYVYGMMTNNGANKVTEGSITKFLASNGPLVDAVPGMRDEMNNLMGLAKKHGSLSSSAGHLMFEGRDPTQAVKYILSSKDQARTARDVLDFGNRLVGGAEGKQYVEGVQKGMIDALTADPAKMGKFFDANASMLRNLFPDRAQIEALNQMRRAESIINRAPDRSFSNLKAFEDLTGGRILDLLLGSAQGKLTSAVAGAMAGSALAKAGVPSLEYAMEILGAAVGLGTRGGVGQAMYGGVADRAKEILSEALKNPKTAEFLMRKATPGAWTNMINSVPEAALRNISSAAGQSEGTL